MNNFFKKTKIVVTLGPATDDYNHLQKIIIAGANIVRLNFSHGISQDHYLRAKNVKKIANNLGKHIAILADLQGPKIRISTFKNNSIFLKKGDQFILDASLKQIPGDCKRVNIDYQKLPNDLIPGDILLLNDGRVQLKVIKIKNQNIITEVTIGGILSNNKGINKLGGGLSANSLTEKDKQDIITAAKIGVDYIAVSFPKNSSDINYARQLVIKSGSNAKIVAKIERAEIVSSDKSIDDIILSSDVIMVARGDLGVEIGDPELVIIQKKLIKRAKYLNKVVITATQMMDSMIINPMPTRAEVMDVANAVIDGTDAVMLSEETATGKFPIKTVKTMANICMGAEKISQFKYDQYKSKLKFNNFEETILLSSIYIGNIIKEISAIITITEDGNDALIMSRIISNKPIFALSSFKKTLNLVNLYRGVIPIYFNYEKDNKKELIYKQAIDLLCNNKLLFIGDSVIILKQNLSNKKENFFSINFLKIK